MHTHLEILAATAPDGHWRPGIGDPTFVGWLTVVAYLVTAALCARTALVERRMSSRSDEIFAREARRRGLPAGLTATSDRSTGPAFWWILAAGLVVLGINKQLDLQTAFTDVGRSLAKAQHWYEVRHSVQRAFIAAIAVFGVVGLAAFSWYFRSAAARSRLAIAGLVFLLTFVTIRAASFHKVDELISRRSLGLKWNWILELGGIALIAASAASRLWSERRSRGG